MTTESLGVPLVSLISFSLQHLFGYAIPRWTLNAWAPRAEAQSHRPFRDSRSAHPLAERAWGIIPRDGASKMRFLAGIGPPYRLDPAEDWHMPRGAAVNIGTSCTESPAGKAGAA